MNSAKNIFPVFALCVAFAASAQGVDAAAARAAYQQQQAIQEVSRLSQQFDQLQNNVETLSARVNSVSNNREVSDLRSEISALRSEVAALKRAQASMRQEIVADLTKRMSTYLASRSAPPPSAVSSKTSGGKSASSKARQPAAPAWNGPCYEHVVEAGQTLSMIAKGYNTTIAKIRQASNLKSDNLRIGQKLLVPKED